MNKFLKQMEAEEKAQELQDTKLNLKPAETQKEPANNKAFTEIIKGKQKLKVCNKCGWIHLPDVKVCPYCGNK